MRYTQRQLKAVRRKKDKLLNVKRLLDNAHAHTFAHQRDTRLAFEKIMGIDQWEYTEITDKIPYQLTWMH